MNKTLVFLLIFICCFANYKLYAYDIKPYKNRQNMILSNTERIDYIQSYKWNKDNEEFELQNNIFYSFGDNDLITEIITLHANDTIGKTSYKYNDRDSIIERKAEGEAFINEWKSFIVNETIEERKYNELGFKVEKIIKKRFVNDKEYYNYSKSLYINNSKGYPTFEELLSWNWDYHDWRSIKRLYYEYDSHNYKTSYIDSSYSSISKSYYLSNRYRYKNTYENDKISSIIEEEYSDNNWNYRLKNSFEYDNNNNIIEETLSIYENDKWRGLYRILYKYNNDYLISIIFQFYDHNMDIFVNSERFDIYYETSNIFNNNWKNTLLIYPNPSRGILTIEGNTEYSTLEDIKIYNINMKEIHNIEILNKTGNLLTFKILPGCYFVIISNDKYMATKKLIVLP